VILDLRPRQKLKTSDGNTIRQIIGVSGSGIF